MTAKIRTLRATDLVNVALFSALDGRDNATTRDRLGLSSPPLATLCRTLAGGLTTRRPGYFCIGLEGQRVWGMASVRMRSGPWAWEIDHLYLDPKATSSGAALLETVSVVAGTRGAQRLFLRLPARSLLTEAARLGGFFPCLTEVLYRRQPSQGSGAEAFPEAALRPRQVRDDHDLFRLYNAATPAEIRSAFGLTLEQWRDAQEPIAGSVQEVVYETGQGIRGWMALAWQGRKGSVALAAHPEERGLPQQLLRLAMATLGPGRQHLCLVPEYAAELQAVAEQGGFQPQEQLCLWIKPLAKMVKEVGFAPAMSA